MKGLGVHTSRRGPKAIDSPNTNKQTGGISMKRHMRMVPVGLVAVVALLLGIPASQVWAAAIQLSDAQIRIEINDTDGDAGIQIFLDGEGWDSMNVFDPEGNEILDFRGEGSVGIQGITELFFESAEPSFDVQTLEELFGLFPEGNYRFEGRTTEGDILKGMAKLTHNVPDGPEILSPAEDEVLDPEAVVIAWNPVTNPFPGTGASTIQIVGYQVIVAREKPQPLLVFSVLLPADTTEVTVSPEFMQAKAEYKVEVLAIEASGNQTISEREFETE